MGQPARVLVTGEQAVFAAQASEVVRSQVLSLILALFGITVLIMIQLRSWVLGLLSIFPNLPPVAVIIGLMGWMAHTSGQCDGLRCSHSHRIGRRRYYSLPVPVEEGYRIPGGGRSHHRGDSAAIL